jgi:prevent-host-death family protein
MPMVNMLEAKTQLSKLVEAVESGAETEVIIARNGKPAARLVPIAQKPRIRLGLHDGEYSEPPILSQEEIDADNEAIARLFYGDDYDAVVEAVKVARAKAGPP